MLPVCHGLEGKFHPMGVEGGTSGGGAVLYKYVMRVWRSRADEAAAGKKKLLWESVCQTGYYCVSEYQPDRFRCLLVSQN